MDEYRKAQERLMQAAYQYGQAQAAMEEAEQEFHAASAALDALENKQCEASGDALRPIY